MPQEVELTLLALETPAATDPSLCLLTANFVGADGTPSAYMPVRFEPQRNPTIQSGNWVGGSALPLTDKDGRLLVQLVRDVQYKVTIADHPDTSYEFVCPDQASALLFDYLIPYPALLKFQESAYALQVGDPTTFVHVLVEMSDGTEVSVGSVTLASDDESVLVVTGQSIRAIGVGSANLALVGVSEAALPVFEDSLGEPLVRLPSPPYALASPIPVTVT